MTVSANTNRIPYTGDGVSTAFTVPFIFLNNADIAVYVAGIKQTTGFTTTGAGVGSGTVTFVSAPANGALVVLVRDPDFLQSTALPANGPFPSDSVERMADKSMIGLQRLQDLQGRSLVLSDGDAAATLTLPLLATRASKFLAFDASGLPVAASGATGLPATATGAALLASATAAAARTVLGSTTVGDAVFIAANAAAARTAMVAAASGANSDITSLTGLTSAINALGQCQMTLSAGSLKLLPFAGNQVTINGRNCTVPDAGVTLAATGLPSTTLQYIYAVATAGVVTSLEASTTAPVVSTTAGNKGVKIKTGDDTRTFVGWAYCKTAATFADSTTQRFTISYFNPRPLEMANVFTANRALTATGVGFAEFNTEIRCEFVARSDMAVSFRSAGGAFLSNSADTGYVALAFDGATAVDAGSAVINGLTAAVPIASFADSRLSDGFHYATVVGSLNTANSLTAVGSATSGKRTGMTGIVWG